ncbi:hypothetical protein CRENBAI_000462 [Crenichthys baileyi]|uniref:Uncharacterized protein n=1 Tax=Crenichthys baileyi TaxID=28760 RepID=A0AAV9QR95_9TELE
MTVKLPFWFRSPACSVFPAHSLDVSHPSHKKRHMTCRVGSVELADINSSPQKDQEGAVKFRFHILDVSVKISRLCVNQAELYVGRSHVREGGVFRRSSGADWRSSRSRLRWMYRF